MFGLGQHIAGQHFRIAGAVGQSVNLGRAGQLINAHGAKHLPLGLIHKGIAGADDLHHLRHRSCAISHRRNRLRAADAENPVSPRQMAARNHRAVGVWRKTRDYLIHPGHLSGNDGHDRGRQQRKPPPRHIASHPFNRDHPVTHEHTRQDLHVQRQDRRQLRAGKGGDIGNGKFRIRAGLRIKFRHSRQPIRHRHFKFGQIRLVKLQGIRPHRRIAVAAHIGQHLRHQRLHRRRIHRGIAVRGLQPTHARKGKLLCGLILHDVP